MNGNPAIPIAQTLRAGGVTRDDVKRILAEGASGKPDECWEWTGARNDLGYGYVRVAGRRFYAHRLSLYIARGRLGSEQLACHTCDNPPCVNPAHLYAGTYRTNSQDASRRGRFPGYCGPLGVGHHKASADSGDIARALAFYADGRGTQAEAAALVGVARTTFVGWLRGTRRAAEIRRLHDEAA